MQHLVYNALIMATQPTNESETMETAKRLVTSSSGKRAYYYFYRNGDEVIGETSGGHDVSSQTSSEEYRYTHGGGLYVAATDMAKKLAATH